MTKITGLSPRAQQCYDLFLARRDDGYIQPRYCDMVSEYLTLIYESYKDFHNGGNEVTQQPGLTVLSRRPILGQDILAIPSRTAGDAYLYQLKTKWCSQLSASVAEVARLLAILYSRSAMPNASEMYGHYLGSTLANPSAVFTRHQLVYIHSPDGVNQINAITRCFSSLLELESYVRDIQLWVAFMKPLCCLLATKLNIPGIPRSRASLFRRNQIVVLAHNWYIECHGGPEKIKIPIV